METTMDSSISDNPTATATTKTETFNCYQCTICLKEELVFPKFDGVTTSEENNYEVHLCRLFGIDLSRVFTVLHPRATFCEDCGERIEKIVELFTHIDSLQENVNQLKCILETDFKNSCDPDNNCFTRDDAVEVPGNEFLRNEIAKSLDCFQETPSKIKENLDDDNLVDDDDFFEMPVEVDYSTRANSEIEGPTSSRTLTPSFKKSQDSPTNITISKPSPQSPKNSVVENNDTNRAISKQFQLKDLSVRIQTLSPEILNNVPINVYEVPGYSKRRSTALKQSKPKMVPFPCDFPDCKMTRTSAELLEIHKKQAHEGIKYAYICDQCGRAFANNSKRQKHIRKHLEKPLKGVRKFNCDFPDCTRKLGFFDETELEMHVKQAHQGITQPWECKECGQCFKERWYLTIHRRTQHLGEYRALCPTCGKGCRDTSDLKNHMNTHTKETPYKCTECDRSFKSTSDRAVHIRSAHTGERPYCCDRCGKGFAKSSALTKHVRAVHNKHTRPYMCHVCGKNFPVKGYLSMHMLYMHKIRASDAVVN